MHGLDFSTAIGVTFGAHHLRQQLKGRQVEHLAHSKVHRLPVLVAHIQADQRFPEETADTKAHFARHDLFVQRHVRDDPPGLGFCHRQVHADKNAVLPITRTDTSDLCLKPPSGNEIQTVDAARDEEHARDHVLRAVQAPLGLGLHDPRIATVDHGGSGLKESRLHDVTRSLGDELAHSALGQLLLTGGVEDGTHRKRQLVAETTIETRKRPVKRGDDVFDGRTVDHRDIFFERRPYARWRCAARERQDTSHSHRGSAKHDWGRHQRASLFTLALLMSVQLMDPSRLPEL